MFVNVKGIFGVLVDAVKLTLSSLTRASNISTVADTSGFWSLSSSGLTRSSQEVMSCRSEVSCCGSRVLHCSLLTACACACSSSQRSITPVQHIHHEVQISIHPCIHLFILILFPSINILILFSFLHFTAFIHSSIHSFYPNIHPSI